MPLPWSGHPRRRWLLLATLPVLALLLWLPLRGTAVEVVRVQAAPLEQLVVASARVATPSRVQVASEVAGVVLERRVAEGDRVVPGQVLAVLRADDARASLDQARARLADLRGAQRLQARAALEEAGARLAQATREAGRREDLAGRQLVSREDAEQARQARTSAQAAHDQARAALEALAPGGPRERELEAAVAAAAATLERHTVRATVAGTVLTRAVEPGDTVQPGTALFEIASEGPVELRMPVDEKNLRLLALGQPARVVADAFPDRTFPATVTYLAPSVDTSRGTVEVRLTVDPVPDFLRQDMTVSVSIITGRRDRALTVPAQAIDRGADGRPRVWKVAAGRLVPVAVAVGLEGATETEVTSGLAAGDRVLRHAAEAPAPGTRVRPRASGDAAP